MVVEKTCANSLRVPFVDACVPEARYVFIHRDGVDAAASAVHRWTAPFELAYTLRKLRFVPVADIPRHASRFLGNRLYRRRSRQRRLGWWGPRPSGALELDPAMPLIDLAAWQWNACVARAATAFGNIAPDRWRAVSYEAFVASPEEGMRNILKFLEVGDRLAVISAMDFSGISAASVGKGRRTLADEDIERLERIQSPGSAAITTMTGLQDRSQS